MHVWWGPDLTVFYNDAYVPAMGDKHPGRSARPASRVWAEIWAELGPLAESVLAGRAHVLRGPLLFLGRHGYLEETYCTFSYSPIQDESGGIGGVFIAVTETTTRVVGERRLQVLRDLGELSTVSAGTAEEACRAVVGVLARHRAEVPFVAAYLGRADAGPAAGGRARRDGRVARRAAHRRPGRRRPGVAGRRVGDGAGRPGVRRRATRCAPCAPGRRRPPTPSSCRSGSPDGSSRPACSWPGVNPHRALDAAYRCFLDLVAGQIATAVIDALAYEADGSGPRRSPSWTAPRPTSSPTSATSSAPR